MTASRGHRATLFVSAAMTVAGIVVGVIGLRGAGDAYVQRLEPPLGAFIALCVGTVLFGVGFMTFLVAVVRPFFARRAVDDAADRSRE
jgi:hypothetical protein